MGALPSNSYSVDWRGTAYTQDSKSPIVAPLTNVLGAAHDSSGGWMTGGPGGGSQRTCPCQLSAVWCRAVPVPIMVADCADIFLQSFKSHIVRF